MVVVVLVLVLVVVVVGMSSRSLLLVKGLHFMLSDCERLIECLRAAG